MLRSGSEASRGHGAGYGDSVRPGQERQQDVASDAVKPLPQDQRQARRHQQYSRA
jgi:hypothetical protein